MPNWCYSSYYFEFAEEDTAKRFTEVLEKASKVTPRGQDYRQKLCYNLRS